MTRQSRPTGRVPVVSPIALLCWLMVVGRAAAFDLPPGFVDEEVVSDLQSPASLAFAPDGRMFIGERINGRLLVAKRGIDGRWSVNATPFHTFDIPKDVNGLPQRHRSSGLRDIAFDPDFSSNGFVYAFYMNDDPRHNRVVRIRTSASDPDVADPSFAGTGEQLLIELPFNGTISSGSHNGGALEFGPDGFLYATTGDGWMGGDPVQSLSTFTGKVVRIASDGSIPPDNPFVAQTTGSHQSIYALGLRNPYTMSRHPDTDELVINEADGTDKADIFILEPGANFGEVNPTIGVGVPRWANAAEVGGILVTGGEWYPTGGPFPAAYHGTYFTPLWGQNGDPLGRITRIASRTDPTVTDFELNVGLNVAGENLKPVVTRIGPDGNLYYLLTTYDTDFGMVRMVRPVNPPSTELDCADGFDEDGDGRVDCDDPDCVFDAACRALDHDGDGRVNENDCAPLDPDAFAVPSEVSRLDVIRTAGGAAVTVSWTDLSGVAGNGTRYDVAGDFLSTLHSVRQAGGACLVTGSNSLSHVDTTPVIADGHYYLVRGVNACGPPAGLGWGRSSLGSPRPACP